MKTTTLATMIGWSMAVASNAFAQDTLPAADPSLLDNHVNSPFRGEEVSAISFAVLEPAAKLEPVVDQSPMLLQEETTAQHLMLTPMSLNAETTGREAQVTRTSTESEAGHPHMTPQSSTPANATRRSTSGSGSGSNSSSGSFNGTGTVTFPKQVLPKSTGGRHGTMAFASCVAVTLVAMLAW